MKLQDKFRVFGENACLAICYIYGALYNTASVEERNNDEFMEVAVASILLTAFRDDKIIADDCTVMDADKLMNSISEKKYKVSKVAVSSATELPLGYAVGKFEFNGKGHWVLFHNQKQLYNSLENSNCVKYGHLTEARVIEEVK